MDYCLDLEMETSEYSEQPTLGLPPIREEAAPIPEKYNKALDEVVVEKIENGEMPDFTLLKLIQRKKFAIAKKRRQNYVKNRTVPVQDLRSKLRQKRALAVIRASCRTAPVIKNRLGLALRGIVKQPRKFAVDSGAVRRLTAKERLGFRKIPRIISSSTVGAPPLILNTTITQMLEENLTYEEEEEEYLENEEFGAPVERQLPIRSYQSQDQQNGYKIGRTFDINHNGFAIPDYIPANRTTGAPPLVRNGYGTGQNRYEKQDQQNNYTSQNGVVFRQTFNQGGRNGPVNDNHYPPPLVLNHNVLADVQQRRFDTDRQSDEYYNDSVPERSYGQSVQQQYYTAPEQSYNQSAQGYCRQPIPDQSYTQFVNERNSRNSMRGDKERQMLNEARTPESPVELTPSSTVPPPASSFIRRQPTPSTFHALSNRKDSRALLPTPQPPTVSFQSNADGPEEYVPTHMFPRSGQVDEIYVPTRARSSNGPKTPVFEAKVATVHVFSTGIPLHQRIQDYSAPIEEEIEVDVKPEPAYAYAGANNY